LADLPYGMAIRWLAILGSNTGLLESVLRLAEEDQRLRRALFNCVSAHRTYREIVHETLSWQLAFKMGLAVGSSLLAAPGRLVESWQHR